MIDDDTDDGDGKNGIHLRSAIICFVTRNRTCIINTPVQVRYRFWDKRQSFLRRQ